MYWRPAAWLPSEGVKKAANRNATGSACSNRFETECTTETHALGHHLCDCVRCFSSRSANARVVKKDDLMVRSKAVRYRRIPGIHVGVEVSKKEQRNSTWLTETTVGVTHAVSLNELCRNRFVCVIAHSLSTPSDLYAVCVWVSGEKAAGFSACSIDSAASVM